MRRRETFCGIFHGLFGNSRSRPKHIDAVWLSADQGKHIRAIDVVRHFESANPAGQPNPAAIRPNGIGPVQNIPVLCIVIRDVEAMGVCESGKTGTPPHQGVKRRQRFLHSNIINRYAEKHRAGFIFGMR